MIIMCFVIIQHTEGIFVFGGVKGQKPNYDSYDDNLYRLTIGSKEHKWSVVKTSGPKPQARYQHSMHFIRKANLLLIIGGRKIGYKKSS